MKAHFEILERDRAAGIAGIDVRRALPGEIDADLEARDDLRAARLGDLDRVANMVVMAMCQQDMGRAGGDSVKIELEFRIAAQKRINENDRGSGFDPESGMAEPGDFHGLLQNQTDAARQHGTLRGT